MQGYVNKSSDYITLTVLIWFPQQNPRVHGNGTAFHDEVGGLNEGHALFNAVSKWPGAAAIQSV